MNNNNNNNTRVLLLYYEMDWLLLTDVNSKDRIKKLLELFYCQVVTGTYTAKISKHRKNTQYTMVKL